MMKVCGWEPLSEVDWQNESLEMENARNNPYRNLKSVAVETRSALEKLYSDYKSEVGII